MKIVPIKYAIYSFATVPSCFRELFCLLYYMHLWWREGRKY